MSKTGKRYSAGYNSQGLWSALLPAGTYHAHGFAGGAPGTRFIVMAGKRLTGVEVWYGCSFS